MARVTLIILGLVGSLPFSLAAQALDSLSSGQRVRLLTGSRSPWMVGTIVAVDADSLHLRLSDTTGQVAIKRGAITRLEVSRGMRSSTGSEARTGLLIGAGVGAVAGLASGNDQSGFIRFTAGQKALFLGVAGGGVGALLGLIIGSQPHEHWDRVSLRDARITLVPHGAGVALSFRL